MLGLDEEFEKLKRFHIDGRRVVFIDDDHTPEGGFGIVRRAELHHSAYLPSWLASRRYGPPQLVAVKQIKVSGAFNMPRVKRAFTREMLVWSSLEAHPGIAKFIGFYADFKRSEAWLLSPWEPNGNVTEFIKAHNLEVPEKLSLVYDSIGALAFLHQLDPPVCHGDIKSANFLVTAEYKARLCDFGLAQLHEDSGFGRLETSTGMKGSIRWCSPEILQDEPRAPTSDVYAWAWLVWEIMTGDLPYQGTSANYAIMAKIFGSTLPQVDGESRLSDCLQVWDLMIRCWNVEPEQRPTARICKTTVTYLPRCTPTPANADHQIRRAELLENLGDLEIWKGNHEKSSAYLDEALLLYQEEEDSRGMANVLRKQAVVAYRNDEDNKASEKAMAALELFRNLNDAIGIADASIWLGRSLASLGAMDEALPILEESLKIYRTQENDVGATHCLEKIGLIENHYSQGKKALLTLDEAVTIASRSGDRLGMSRALRSLAYTHRRLGDFAKATTYYSESNRIARSIGWELGLVSTLGPMVQIKMESGDYRETEELIQESILIAQKGSLRRLLAASFWKLGDCFREQSKFNEATAALEESCLLYQELSRHNQAKDVAYTLAEVESSRGDWKRALFWHDYSIGVCRSQEDPWELADHLGLKSRTLVKARRYDEAALHLEAAIVIYKEKESSWDWERRHLCAIPTTVMQWERRLPLLCDMKKLQRRLPHLVTASLKLPIPTGHVEP
ncbi:hypothetical protein M407DRAFT_30930 [Tulasnella calospora MUT 4182]|uniref:Protein kinase domain-containing protein n=1 Tax=Tulasnella calospora MUT 4182 TaxID=1051891 RepID=A0A0C3LDA0_9AGAM|nr:hypothetical protein M407DRAFT_30930 [Tulasnella calospora MUT 4182]